METSETGIYFVWQGQGLGRMTPEEFEGKLTEALGGISVTFEAQLAVNFRFTYTRTARRVDTIFKVSRENAETVDRITRGTGIKRFVTAVSESPGMYPEVFVDTHITSDDKRILSAAQS